MLSNKPFLIWLLTIPPHLKYVATLPCNLSIIACFRHISQGGVAKYAWCGGIFSNHCILQMLRIKESSGEKIVKIG